MLGKSLAETQFDIIFCSPLERAQATARAVEQRQRRRPPIVVMRDLLEVGDYGEETPAECHARARRVFLSIKEQAREGACVLVVAHGSFNNRLLTALLNLPAPDVLFRFGQDNTGLTRVIFYGEDTPKWERIRLERLNDVSHLKF